MATMLIDTQVWLWSRTKPERLRKPVQALLTDPDQTLLFSAVSIVEIAIKYSVGKLQLPSVPAQFIPPRLAEDQLTILNLEARHGLVLAELPLHHRDPFDRMLIAQARCEKVAIVTSDPWFDQYDIDVIPAA